MNLAKHDPETEMEMNMTPMIDVVFLLIIFFMIITDMTQQDLEELTLPMAATRPSVTAKSPSSRGLPRPSAMRALRTIRSCMSVCFAGTG